MRAGSRSGVLEILQIWRSGPQRSFCTVERDVRCTELRNFGVAGLFDKGGR